MRKIFNKVLAGVITTSLVATLAIGINFGSKEVKAEEANAITTNWTNASPSWQPEDAVITGNSFVSTASSIKADIVITGWQANWTTEPPVPDDAIVIGAMWGEKPFQLTSTNKAKIVPGNTYKLNFTVQNGMKSASGAPTEKNITISVNSGIEGDNDNTFLFETVRVAANETKTFSFDVPISADYLSDDVQIQFAYGSYSYSYNLTKAVESGEVSEEDAKACKYAYAYGTTEDVNATGTLTFTDISLMGEKYNTSVIPPKETDGSAVKPTDNSKVDNPSTPVQPKVKKMAKVKKLKAKNTKKGTVKITWKKVAKAKKYTVKVGKKTYTTKKVKLTVKKLKKGKKYTVKVRAKAVKGYKVGAWAKTTVKVKK